MRILLTSILPFILVSLFGRWYYIDKIRHMCPNCPKTSLIDSSSHNLLQKQFDPFLVESSTLSSDNQDFIVELSNFMVKNPDATLRIISKYEKEKAGSDYIVFLKNKLTGLGIRDNRIITEVKNKDESGCSSIDFIASLPEKPKIKVFYGRDLNFDPNSADFHSTPTFDTYVDSLILFCSENKGRLITITGHTDNIGDDKINMELGRKRADAIKDFLIQKGLNANVITDSKGETQPIAPNDKEENRYKNRRVEISIN